MKTLITICSIAALGLAVTTHAQQDAAVAARGRAPIAALEGSVVKGQPYSAEVVTESVQTLADGNRIVRRTTGRVYRDGEGRVRREEDRVSGTPTISINDPVAKKTVTLDPATRTARETPSFFLFAARLNDITIRQYELAVDLLGEQRKALAEVRQPAAFSNDATAVAGGRGGARGRVGGPGAVEETLADRFIEGVTASGVRRTTTIEKGAIGNDMPIKIVSEEWRSNDLGVLVLTDLSDPRTGRTTYRLLSITRGEPDPQLFRVPADYTLVGGRDGAPAAGAGGRGRVGRGGRP